MQVKLFESNSTCDLETKINRYIEDRDDVIDIKYQSSSIDERYSNTKFSAMVITK